MDVDDIDISAWDSRTQELVRKHGLETFRYEAWKSIYQDNMRGVELEYLRHTGGKVYNDHHDQCDPNSHMYDVQGAIETSKEARRIFLLFEELDTSQQYGRRAFVKQLREGIDMYLSAVSNEE